MPVVPTDQIAILNAVVARLISQISGLTASTCFLSDAPEPAANVTGSTFLTVAPSGSRFDEEAQIGAGEQELIEYAGVSVTIFTKMQLDRVEHATSLLTEETRGLLAMKKSVLKALVGHNLQVAAGDGLVAYMRAVNASAPGYTQSGLGRLSLMFSTEFLWDLS